MLRVSGHTFNHNLAYSCKDLSVEHGAITIINSYFREMHINQWPRNQLAKCESSKILILRTNTGMIKLNAA